MRSALGLAEKGRAFAGVVPELMAKDAEGAWGIAEAGGDIRGRVLIDEESAESFILPLEWRLRGEEEVQIGRCYPIASTVWHTHTMLQKHFRVNMFFAGGRDFRLALCHFI